MQQQLPKTSILQTNYNNKYLRYLNDLRLITEDEYSDPESIFETEVSSTASGLFVSIKSLHNNKYLVVSKSENDEHLVSPTAETTNEDESNESCTLFKPYFVGENDNNSQVRFYHAHYKNYLCFSVTNSGFFLPSSSDDDDDKDELFDLFTFTDIEPEPPSGNEEYSFKGDNGKYLSVFLGKDDENTNENKIIPYLKFCADHNDPNNQDVWFKCHIPRDGNKLFEIKWISENSLWECGTSKWVVVDSTKWVVVDSRRERHKQTLFRFDWAKSALIVNGNYCQRNDQQLNSDKLDCLIAKTPIFTEQARLELERKKLIEDDDSDTKSSI